MERREKLGDYYEGDKRWDEMLLKVWYFSLIIYASIRTMPGCGKTWVCFAHFFFKEGAGGLLRRQGGKRWEERLLEEEASLCSDVAASSYWTPHPPSQTPHPPALPFFRACKNIASWIFRAHYFLDNSYESERTFKFHKHNVIFFARTNYWAGQWSDLGSIEIGNIYIILAPQVLK